VQEKHQQPTKNENKEKHSNDCSVIPWDNIVSGKNGADTDQREYGAKPLGSL